MTWLVLQQTEGQLSWQEMLAWIFFLGVMGLAVAVITSIVREKKE